MKCGLVLLLLLWLSPGIRVMSWRIGWGIGFCCTCGRLPPWASRAGPARLDPARGPGRWWQCPRRWPSPLLVWRRWRLGRWAWFCYWWVVMMRWAYRWSGRRIAWRNCPGRRARSYQSPCLGVSVSECVRERNWECNRGRFVENEGPFFIYKVSVYWKCVCLGGNGCLVACLCHITYSSWLALAQSRSPSLKYPSFWHLLKLNMK